MKKKIIALLLTALIVLSLTACGNGGKVTPEEFDNMTEDEQEAYLEEQLDRLDEEAEREDAEEEAEAAAAEEEPAPEEEPEITDYTLPNLDLKDIDPEASGAFDIIGLDFSSFPMPNGDYTTRWDWESYDDTPYTSKTTGLSYTRMPSYTLTFKADSDFYSNYEDELIAWLEAQPGVVARNSNAADQSYQFGYAVVWLDANRSLIMDTGNSSVSFTVHEWQERSFEGIVTSVTGSDDAISWLSIKSETTVDEFTAGSDKEVSYFSLTPLNPDCFLDGGPQMMNGADISDYVNVDPSLQPGDHVTVTVTGNYLQYAYFTCGTDFLSISITKTAE